MKTGRIGPQFRQDVGSHILFECNFCCIFDLYPFLFSRTLAREENSHVQQEMGQPIARPAQSIPPPDAQDIPGSTSVDVNNLLGDINNDILVRKYVRISQEFCSLRVSHHTSRNVCAVRPCNLDRFCNRGDVLYHTLNSNHDIVDDWITGGKQILKSTFLIIQLSCTTPLGHFFNK